VLPYDQLMQELDVTNVRELEDFLINECMYAVGFLPAAFHSFYNYGCFFFPLFFFLWENGVDWASKMYKIFYGVVVLSVSYFLSRLL